MLYYIQKVSLQNRNDPILRDGWVIMGTGINTPKCHHRLSLEVCCGWLSSFLSFSLLFIHIFQFFFSAVNMFSFYHLKNLKSLTKCPHLILHTTGKELPWEDAFRLSPLPSLHSTARGKECLLEGVWAILILPPITAWNRSRELSLKNTETHSAGPGHLATAVAQGPGWVQQSEGR